MNSQNSSAQVQTKKVKGHEVVTGYFENGQPYAKIGHKPEILVIIEALSFEHKPPHGMMLRQFVKTALPFIEHYTVYQIGRQPNLPKGYFFEHMAGDYARVIQDILKRKVSLMGISSGGQLAHYIAADYHELVDKVIIIAAAYRLSEKGVDIEKRSAEYFEKQQYGKSMATLMELIQPKGIKRAIMKSLAFLFGSLVIKNVEYPNDFQVEVAADRQMNFKSRLHEIKAPVLILCGEKDICYNACDMRETAEGIPNARLILYEKYGHNLAVAHYNKISKEILMFLQKTI